MKMEGNGMKWERRERQGMVWQGMAGNGREANETEWKENERK